MTNTALGEGVVALRTTASDAADEIKRLRVELEAREPVLWEGVCEDGHVHEWTHRMGVIRETCAAWSEWEEGSGALPKICGKPLTVKVIGFGPALTTDTENDDAD